MYGLKLSFAWQALDWLPAKSPEIDAQDILAQAAISIFPSEKCLIDLN